MKLTLEEKLEKKFDEGAKARLIKGVGKRVCFLWCSLMGTDGVRYGSYKQVREDELAQRQYILEEADYAPSIFYTDVLHCPRTGKNIPK